MVKEIDVDELEIVDVEWVQRVESFINIVIIKVDEDELEVVNVDDDCLERRGKKKGRKEGRERGRRGFI